MELCETASQNTDGITTATVYLPWNLQPPGLGLQMAQQ